MNNSKRSLARYLSMQAVYQFKEGNLKYDDVLVQFIELHLKNICFDFERSEKKLNLEVDKNYFIGLFTKYIKEENEINELIKNNLDKHWTVNRLPLVLRAILKVAIAEMLMSPKLSIGIIASEYIILTETFCDVKETSFVNAFIENTYNFLKKKKNESRKKIN